MNLRAQNLLGMWFLIEATEGGSRLHSDSGRIVIDIGFLEDPGGSDPAVAEPGALPAIVRTAALIFEGTVSE